MIRLYWDKEFKVGDQLSLPDGELRYYSTVRRGKGEVRIFNRQGQEAIGKMKRNTFEVENILRVIVPQYRLTVAVGLPENSILPNIIRSISELGARELVFFGGDRTQSAKKRLVDNPRFEKMSLESARQCGRGAPLEIKIKKDLKAVLSDAAHKIWFFDEAEDGVKLDYSAARPEFSATTAIIGCEGGWSDEERAAAKNASCQWIHFRTPILRVETAVVAAAFYAVERMKPSIDALR